MDDIYMNHRMTEIVLQYIEYKTERSKFEKDIYDTFRVLVNNTSVDDLLRQLRRNEKYGLTRSELIMAEAESGVNMSFAPEIELTEQQIKHNLHNQLLVMCAKYDFT